MQISLLKLNQVLNSAKNTESPFLLFFKRRPNTKIPNILPNKVSPILIQIANKNKFDQQAKIMSKRHRFGHNDFQLEDKILTQNLKTKKWDIPGTIIELIKSEDLENRSFAIRTNANKVLWRSARYIHLVLTHPTIQQQNNQDSVDAMKIIES